MHGNQKLKLNRENFDQMLMPTIVYVQAARMAPRAADQARWQVCIFLNCMPPPLWGAHIYLHVVVTYKYIYICEDVATCLEHSLLGKIIHNDRLLLGITSFAAPKQTREAYDSSFT